MKVFKVFFKELLKTIKTGGLNKKIFKCLLFYLLSSFAGSLIKDLDAQEEYYELCSIIESEDGLF